LAKVADVHQKKNLNLEMME